MNIMQNSLLEMGGVKQSSPSSRKSDSDLPEKDEFRKLINSCKEKEFTSANPDKTVFKPEKGNTSSEKDQTELDLKQQLVAMQFGCMEYLQVSDMVCSDTGIDVSLAAVNSSCIAVENTMDQQQSTLTMANHTQSASPEMIHSEAENPGKPVSDGVEYQSLQFKQVNLESASSLKHTEENPDFTAVDYSRVLPDDSHEVQQKDSEMPELEYEMEINEDESVFGELETAPVKVSDVSQSHREIKPDSVEKQVGDNLVSILHKGHNHVKIQLNPSSLGHITVDLVQNKDGNISITLRAEHPDVRNLLEQNVSQLQGLLKDYSNQNVQIQLPQENNQNHDEFQQQQNQSQQQNHPQQQQSKKESSAEDFMNQLRLGLVSTDS